MRSSLTLSSQNAPLLSTSEEATPASRQKSERVSHWLRSRHLYRRAPRSDSHCVAAAAPLPVKTTSICWWNTCSLLSSIITFYVQDTLKLGSGLVWTRPKPPPRPKPDLWNGQVLWQPKASSAWSVRTLCPVRTPFKRGFLRARHILCILISLFSTGGGQHIPTKQCLLENKLSGVGSVDNRPSAN